MTKNTLTERVLDFLKNFPPFSMLSKNELQAICEQVQIYYFDKNDFCFTENEAAQDRFYIVHEGAIGLFRNVEKEMLIDICDEGDVFGLRPLINNEKYMMSAKAVEESIVYGIPIEVFKNIYDKNQKVSNYLISCFASNNNQALHDTKHLSGFSTDDSPGFHDLQRVSFTKKPAQCSPETSIQDAALLMTRKKTGCLIVTENKKPIGIVTDRDIRTKVATGKFDSNCLVSAIMSSPVKTFSEDITVTEAQMAMLDHSIGHLCITKDGKSDSVVKGIISDRDLLVMQGNSPTVLVREIKRTDSVKSLKFIRENANQLLESYLNQNIPILLVSKIISEINDVITKRTIELALEDMKSSPPCTFVWLAIGSQGRQEQLLLTDQDHALIYENIEVARQDEVKNYFLKLAKKVSKSLNLIGFEYCGADMMASNPRWCLSIDEWEKQFTRWINEPGDEEIRLSSIFFDYRPVFGNHALSEQLTDCILGQLNKNQIFLTSLGNNTLRKPTPLGFFRQFLLEKNGEHKDTFDIKVRALMPLIDAARMIILDHGVRSFNNSIQRYEKLVELEPQNAELYSDCIEAFKVFLHYRTKQGLTNKDSGRFIKLESLSKADRILLKSSFQAISDIQELLKIRYNLYYY